MDNVDDILSQNQVVEEEEEDDEELDEDIADAAGGATANEEEEEPEDEEMENDEDDDEDDEDDDDDDDGEEDEDEDDDEEEDVANADGQSEDKQGTQDVNTSTESSTDQAGDKLSAFDKIHNYYTQLYRSAKLSESYTIYPTAAIPIQTHVHSLTMSKGLKYLFLGGDDGYIRKFDFLNSIEGKLSLTILQKHSLVESISNAGILVSYWENEIPQRRKDIKLTKNGKEYEPMVSPVHALEVQNECLFLLSGLQNGGITLQGCRYMEGSISHYFSKHTSVVNQLRLNDKEDKFISGGWDKQILEWDLNTGDCVNEFKGSVAQLSSLEFRPLFSTVAIDSLVEKEPFQKQEQIQQKDDDMDSLFGDEDEEEKRMDFDTQSDDRNRQEKQSMQEISKNTLKTSCDESIFLTSSINGSIHVWDRRTPAKPVVDLQRGPQVPPWCMSACWSMDGDRIYAGRRNAAVEEFDLKMGVKPSKTLKFPSISGPVSCVRAMPNNRHVLCASNDNIRIYDVNQYTKSSSNTPFLIVPGHHGGMISNLYVDPTCRFLISTSGSRGWQGQSTDTTLIYEIDLE